jgi:catechol 2,3-dioxygenase-like lactoylglutathione lyase family enzyme/DNA-binding CsgD family transcriptional regulator
MSSRRRGRPRHPDVLTPTEWSVLDMYRHGLSRKYIAQRRGTSDYAVRYHLRNIAGKLGIAGTRDLRHWPGMPATSPMKPADQRARRHAHMENELSLGPLAQISMLCRSAERTETWYRDVLRLPHVFTFGDLVFFDCSGTRLYIREVPETEFRLSSTLYFAVDDMSTAVRVLEGRGVKFQGAPHMIFKDPETGVEEWFAFFEDPDGNSLSLLSRVGAAGDSGSNAAVT